MSFIEPTGPDVRPIIELHRGNDGYVAFQRRGRDGKFEPVCSVRASELDQLFPEFIAPHVDEESYFTINASFLSAKRLARRSEVIPEMTHACWGSEILRWLTACYVDLDCYKMGLTVGQCLGWCVDAQDKGIIPPVSIYMRSGRGLWAFWMLHEDGDDNIRIPVRAWSEKISTYRRIERQMLRKFANVGSDAKAADPSRVTRVPGSLHRGAGRRVDYWFQMDQDGRPFSYRLDELAVLVGARPTRYTPSLRSAVNPAASERAKKGYDASHKQRLSRMLNLIGQRGFIEEGCRNHAALLLASFMNRARVDDAEIIENVTKFGKQQCRPALTDTEIADALKKRKQYPKFSDYTIADWLKITPAEAELVGWPAEGTRPPEADTKPTTRRERTQIRRELVRQCVELVQKNGRGVPTIRTIMGFIEQRTGEKPSLFTVKKDLEALGIENPRAWRTEQDEGPGLLEG